MRPNELILLRAVLLTVLIDISTSLKCANCFISKTLCNNEIQCKPGQVCYASKIFRFQFESFMYDAGCGRRDTHCHGESAGSIFGRPEETKCCDSGDMCNTKITFTLGASATKAPPFQLNAGIECQVCSGPTCGVKGDDPMMKCPDTFPYCMNIVLNDPSGSKFVTKRCAKRSECQRKQDSACVNFDPSEIFPKSIECMYCCQTNGCNRDVVPRTETLLLG